VKIRIRIRIRVKSWIRTRSDDVQKGENVLKELKRECRGA
jgi:hypothetical protein